MTSSRSGYFCGVEYLISKEEAYTIPYDMNNARKHDTITLQLTFVTSNTDISKYHLISMYIAWTHCLFSFIFQLVLSQTTGISK